MGWKDWSYTKKGALIGFLFGFVFLIFTLIFNFLLEIPFLGGIFFNVFSIISIVPVYIFYFLLDLESFFSRLNLSEGAFGLLFIVMFIAPILYLIIGAFIGWIIDIKCGNKLISHIPFWVKGGLIGILISIFCILKPWEIFDNIVGDILHVIYYYIGLQWTQYISIIDIHPDMKDIILRILNYIGFFIFGALIGVIYGKIKLRSKK